MLKAVNLGVAFLLELAMLAAFAYRGFQAENTLVKLLLGIGVPVAAIVIWGRFMAPRSNTRLKGTSYTALKFALFGAAAVALAAAGQTTLAIIFAVVAVINQILLTVWKPDTAEYTTLTTRE